MTDITVPDGLPILSAGSHGGPEEGACFMEYTSLLAGLSFTDYPSCTDIHLAKTMQQLNDMMPSTHRQKLVPLLGRAIGLRAPADKKHAHMRLTELVCQKMAQSWGYLGDPMFTVVPELFLSSLRLWAAQRGYHGYYTNKVWDEAVRRAEQLHTFYEEAMDELGYPRQSTYHRTLTEARKLVGSPA